MDDKTVGSSKVDAVLHDVTFYPQSSHTGHPKVMRDAHMKVATLAGSSHASHDVSVHKNTQKTVQPSKKCVVASKCKTLDRRPKSIESLRSTNSNYRLIRKPKYTLLPYKRGQLKFCTKLENVAVRNGIHGTVNSEVAAQKENKVGSNNCGGTGNAVSEKLNTRAGTSGRFFKANFGNRRQLIFNVCGVTASRVKLNHLKQHKRNIVLRNKQLCLNDASNCSKPEGDTEAAGEPEFPESELSSACNVDGTCESLCEEAIPKKPEVAVESAEAAAKRNQASSITSLAAIEQHSDITSTSDKAPVVTSASELYSNSPATSPGLKHGTFPCSLFSVCV